jgi:hypothetical protein
MKKVILLLSLLIGLSSIAQNATKRFALLSESKVKDMDVYKKNLPVTDAFARKIWEGVMGNRAVHQSETGSLYNFSFVDGDENFGKFIAIRGTFNNKFYEAYPKIADENWANIDGSFRRSTWIRINALEFLPADFKLENYNFRKVIIETVPANQQEAYEKEQLKLHEIELKIGIKFLSVTWKAIDGYSTNTYMTLIPDNSILDFYTHFTERQKIRKNSKEYNDFNNTTVITNINRIDHLWRIH